MVVHVDDDGLTIDSGRMQVNAVLHDWQAQQLADAAHTLVKKIEPFAFLRRALYSLTLEESSLSKRLNIIQMVGLTGFEPATP